MVITQNSAKNIHTNLQKSEINVSCVTLRHSDQGRVLGNILFALVGMKGVIHEINIYKNLNFIHLGNMMHYGWAPEGHFGKHLSTYAFPTSRNPTIHIS